MDGGANWALNFPQPNSAGFPGRFSWRCLWLTVNFSSWFFWFCYVLFFLYSSSQIWDVKGFSFHMFADANSGRRDEIYGDFFSRQRPLILSAFLRKVSGKPQCRVPAAQMRFVVPVPGLCCLQWLQKLGSWIHFLGQGWGIFAFTRHPPPSALCLCPPFPLLLSSRWHCRRKGIQMEKEIFILFYFFYCWRSCRNHFAFWWCSIILSTRQAHTILIPPLSISSRMQISISSEQFYWLGFHLNGLSWGFFLFGFGFLGFFCLGDFTFPRIFLFVQKNKNRVSFGIKTPVEILGKKKQNKTTLLISWVFLFFNLTRWDCRNNLFCSVFSSLLSSCIWKYYVHNQFLPFTVVIPLFMGC